ncbi:MAG: sulfatase-like hydrolase/transferase, partial [Planctomycetales bacterium]|nr:sulfatase-like hydrolase/transferase [Planctomycetales bacterium]
MSTALFLLLVPAAGTVGSAQASTSKNLVVILVDDGAYAEFGFSNDLFSQGHVTSTPTIDALAQSGTIFSQGYVSAPLCGPSRVGLLTGQYSQRIGYENNITTNASTSQGLPAATLTIADHLKALGYTTGMVGKWHLGYQDGVNRPPDAGFDEFYGMWSGARSYFPLPSTSSIDQIRRGDVSIESTWRTEGDPSLYDPVKGRYITDAFGEESADFINRHASDEQPFFLYTSMTAPHSPLEVKQEDYDYFDGLISDPGERTIAAMNHATDRAVGMIHQALQDNNIAENTVIVFLNDNGAPIRSYDSSPNDPFQGNKGSLWEGGTRVPFFIAGAGASAQVYDQPVTALDILPTFVSMAGGDPDGVDTDGVDLTPFL